MMKKRLLILVAFMMSTSLACILSDVQDAVETIGKGIELLQEIEESGTWSYIGDGLESIDQANGFAGTIEIQSGTPSDTGETLVEVADSVIWNISTDANGNSRLSVIRDDEERDYILVQDPNNSNRQQAYRVVGDNRYECLNQADYNEDIFATSIEGAFAEYSALAIGVQAMSIAEEAGTESINGFTTTQYDLVSKLDEALEIASEFPSPELQQEIDNLPGFYIAGTINVDQASGALVRFSANYANIDDREGNTFLFTLSELGNQPAVPVPSGSEITVACTSGVSPTSTP